MVEGWKHIPYLQKLEHVLYGALISNLTKVIMASLLQYGGLSKTNMASKLIMFSANDMLIFQGAKTNVIIQLKEKCTPFMFKVHCVARQTNLTIQAFSKLPLMSKIEVMLHFMYKYLYIF
jgi:hypothetical protein